MNAPSAANFTFPRSRSTRMRMSATNMHSCHAARAWEMVTDQSSLAMGQRFRARDRMISAYLALQLYLGDFKHVIVPFNQIFDAVKNNQAGAGLIIHEGQHRRWS